MSVSMAMLALLDGGPSHGWALKQRYDQLLGQGRELKFGQVYATLARLQRDGLVQDVGFARGDGAERRVYAITERGVEDFDTWLRTPHLPSGRPAELFTKVVLAIESGRPAAQVLIDQQRVYRERMRQLTAARHQGDAIDRLAGDFEIAHLEADLKWIELAAARLSAQEQKAGEEQKAAQGHRVGQESNAEREPKEGQ
ncbi:MAG: PadR family transcriptional regulator [Bifidobacteriaceae bacterium]|jgi:DNA-binding PadR family transcriptional regulator|nr:PadR family transcriptional regulator [Bifidobacteriaceae bacterium]